MNFSICLFFVHFFSAYCFSTKKGSYLYMRKERSLSPIYHPITPNQKSYVESMENSPIVIGIGPAGTGKTLFACSHAIQQLKTQSIEKIIITRPVVPVEEDIGYLPGKLNTKMEPWTRPLFDIFHEYYDVKSVAQMLQCGVIEIAPLAYMRGRTFKNSLIIADEMQNSSPNQMLMIATRLGSRSQLIITGDLNQSDKMEDNGLKDLLEKKQKYDKNHNITNSNVNVTYFDESDVQRSTIVNEILDIYNNYNRVPKSHTVKNDMKKTSTPKPRAPKKNMNDAALIPLDHVKKLQRNGYNSRILFNRSNKIK